MYYKKMSDMEVQILSEGLELFIQKKENMKEWLVLIVKKRMYNQK